MCSHRSFHEFDMKVEEKALIPTEEETSQNLSIKEHMKTAAKERIKEMRNLESSRERGASGVRKHETICSICQTEFWNATVVCIYCRCTWV